MAYIIFPLLLMVTEVENESRGSPKTTSGEIMAEMKFKTGNSGSTAHSFSGTIEHQAQTPAFVGWKLNFCNDGTLGNLREQDQPCSKGTRSAAASQSVFSPVLTIIFQALPQTPSNTHARGAGPQGSFSFCR